MKTIAQAFWLCSVLLTSVTLHAGEPALPGAATSSWLSLQSEGGMASSNPQTVSKAYQDKAALRFMKTLEQEIPAANLAKNFSTK